MGIYTDRDDGPDKPAAVEQAPRHLVDIFEANVMPVVVTRPGEFASLWRSLVASLRRFFRKTGQRGF